MLLDCASLDGALETCTTLDPNSFGAFGLIVIQKSETAVVTSDGLRLAIELPALLRPVMLTSSSLGDDVVEGVVSERLAQHDWNYGFIIDGFPRSERQAEFFLEGYDIDGVIHLYLPDSEVRRRVLARRLCAGCGMDYNLIDNSPSNDGRCDACGGELVRREDDTEEALAVGSASTTRRRTEN